jgi:hypothetical protein
MAGAQLDGAHGDRSLGALLRELAEGSAALVRKEVELVRVETHELMMAAARGTAAVAVGGALALLGTLALVTGLILLIGNEWLRNRYWLAALLATLVAGVTAVVFARRGRAMLSSTRLKPVQTMATLTEDKEWLKRQRTSGAISS